MSTALASTMPALTESQTNSALVRQLKLGGANVDEVLDLRHEYEEQPESNQEEGGEDEEDEEDGEGSGAAAARSSGSNMASPSTSAMMNVFADLLWNLHVRCLF